MPAIDPGRGRGQWAQHAVFAWRVDAAAPLLAVAVLAAAGLLYGLLGVVVGTLLLRELEGSLVLVFLADADNVLASGLFDVGEIASFAPLSHPHALFETAVLDGELADGHLLPTLPYLVGLLAVATLAHAVTVDGGVSG